MFKFVHLQVEKLFMKLHTRIALASASVFLWPALILSQSELPPSNPGRPTVATPATLTPVGYLQFEDGAQYSTGTPGMTAQLGFSQISKLTVTPRLQLINGWSPYAFSSATPDGPASQEPGGIGIGAQAILLPGGESRPTLAVSYMRSIYGGTAPDLDIGGAFQTGTILLSQDFGKFHMDLNGMVSQQNENGIRRAQYGDATCFSHPFGRYTIAAEFWHFTQPFQRGNVIGNLWGVSYTARPNLVFDVAMSHGFTSTSTEWEYLAGFTYLLPHRLWPAR